MRDSTLHFDTIVIGGGQAGLSVGYYLQQNGRNFVILDANQRIGDAWRKRWDSLRLFTPARYDGLPGMPFPARGHVFPTKDEMANYLELYAAHFKLPVRTGVKATRLSKQGDRFVVTASDPSPFVLPSVPLSIPPSMPRDDDQAQNRSEGKQQSLRFEAEHVVVAMANWQSPRVPPFAPELDSRIIQLHSSEYRNLSQLQDGGVLVVGAGNSGADIAIETVRSHPTWLSGRDTGHIPFRIEGVAARLLLMRLVLRLLFHRVLTVNTPIGRRARPKLLNHAKPLVRVLPTDLATAGVERVPRTVGARGGQPILEDGRVLDVANIVWCTGFHPDFSWIDLPVFGLEEPLHERGVVTNQPGLYFVGLDFLYAVSSAEIHGVGRDAEHVVKTITAQASARRRSFDERVDYATS